MFEYIQLYTRGLTQIKTYITHSEFRDCSESTQIDIEILRKIAFETYFFSITVKGGKIFCLSVFLSVCLAVCPSVSLLLYLGYIYKGYPIKNLRFAQVKHIFKMCWVVFWFQLIKNDKNWQNFEWLWTLSEYLTSYSGCIS